jgi:diacylglycerol kinase (ATP)
MRAIDAPAALSEPPLAPAPPPLTVVVNANASGAPRGAALDRLVGHLRRGGGDVDVARTASVDELRAVWEADDGRRVVLVGGDGSLHTAVNLGGPRRDVALVPAGRANNIARSLRIPRDPAAAALLAGTGRVKPVDLIEAVAAGRPRRLVCESVSVGFLAEARQRYRGRNSADVVAGLRAGATTLRGFHPLSARVSRAEAVETLHLAQVFVANLPLYEFGLDVCPYADATDALLDVVAIEAPDRLAVLRMVAALRRGTQFERPGTHVWRSAHVTVTSGAASPIVADSEDLGHGPVSLRAAPGALRIVRP